MNNNKRAKFLELANNRVNNALKAITLIGNLSNRGSYEYNKADIEKISKALSESIESVLERFEPNGSVKSAFHLE